jgi:hypothetical protein
MVLSLLGPTSNAFAKDYDVKQENEPFINSENVIALAEKYSSTPEYIDEDTVFIPLTEEQNINYIADIKKISRSSAKKLINEKNSSLENSKSVNDSEITILSYPHIGPYNEYTGIVLKRFNVVSGISTTCTVVAAINVLIRVYYTISSYARQFMTVYDTGITMDESGIWTWSTNTKSAIIMSNGFLNLNASGTISGTISVSVSSSYEAAGFTVGVSIGSNVYVNKFQVISYSFDPEYQGGILY